MALEGTGSAPVQTPGNHVHPAPARGNTGQPAPIDAGHSADSLANSPIGRRNNMLAAGHMRSGGGHPEVAFHHNNQALTPVPLGVTSTHRGTSALQPLASSIADNQGAARVVRLDQAQASGARNMSQFGSNRPSTVSPGTGNQDQHHIAATSTLPPRARHSGPGFPVTAGPPATKALESAEPGVMHGTPWSMPVGHQYTSMAPGEL